MKFLNKAFEIEADNFMIESNKKNKINTLELIKIFYIKSFK